MMPDKMILQDRYGRTLHTIKEGGARIESKSGQLMIVGKIEFIKSGNRIVGWNLIDKDNQRQIFPPEIWPSINIVPL